MDIDTNKHMRWIGNTVRFSEKCESCSFSPVCFGACCPKENIFEILKENRTQCGVKDAYGFRRNWNYC